jgi:hypothetical protein
MKMVQLPRQPSLEELRQVSSCKETEHEFGRALRAEDFGTVAS